MNYDLCENYFDFLVPSAFVKNYMKQKIKRKTMT